MSEQPAEGPERPLTILRRLTDNVREVDFDYMTWLEQHDAAVDVLQSRLEAIEAKAALADAAYDHVEFCARSDTASSLRAEDADDWLARYDALSANLAR